MKTSNILLNVIFLSFCTLIGNVLTLQDKISYDYLSGLCGIASEEEDAVNNFVPTKLLIETKDLSNIPDSLLYPQPNVTYRAKSTSSFPWIAQVRYGEEGKDGYSEFRCSAVIISKLFLLTSTACIDGFAMKYIIIRVGDIDETKKDEFEANYVYKQGMSIEPALSPFGYKDLTIIKIKPGESGEGITFSKDVLPACLPSADAPFIENMVCSVGGYKERSKHSVNEKSLIVSHVPLVNFYECRQYVGNNEPGQFCAGGVYDETGECPANAGSPLVCKINGRSIVYGIMAPYGCGSKEKTSLYADIRHSLPWLAHIMK